jgi:hypothetical protein
MVDFYRSLVESITNTSNRKTVGRGVVEVPGNMTDVIAQVPVPSTCPGKRRRPPETAAANVVEVPVAVPNAARPCRETRRVGRTRIGRIPTPWSRLGSRALHSSTCAEKTTQEGP